MSDQDKQRWERETYNPAVRRVPERKASFETESGLPVEPAYTAEDIGSYKPAARNFAAR